MRTKYIGVIATAITLLGAGTVLALNLKTGAPADDAPTVIETNNCCLTGDCCCPLQGACCAPNAKASVPANVKFVKKAGAGCCLTGDCCCPLQSACCASTAKKGAEPFICPETGAELPCPNCCPLNQMKK
jgi:hypothetical protein